MDVYVLLGKMESGEMRPVAVTTRVDVANEWGNMLPDNDWVPFELDDLSLTGMTKDIRTEFKQKPLPTAPQTQKQLEQIQKQLEEAQRLQEEMLSKPPAKRRK